MFDRAQELRDPRRREKGEDSDSYSPHALLCGKVFCAHCGNRLNITSSGRTRLRADGSTVKEKRFRYSCHYNVRHPGQCDGQSGYGVTKLDAIVESIVCTKFSEILECSKSKLLQDMLRKDMEVAQKEVSRAKSELDLKDDERNALKDEMIRVIRGKSSIDRDMIQQLLDENQAAIQAAQDALTAAQNKLEEIERENKKAENDCSNLFTWASTYQNASFQQRQAILNQFIKESVLDGIMILRSSSMFRWRSLKNLRVIRSRCVLRVGGKRTLNKHPLGGWVLRMGESSFLTKLLVKR